MKYKKYTKKDFAWINWTPADIKKAGEAVIAQTEKKFKAVKAVSGKRTFKNTFFPLEELDGVNEAQVDLISILENASTDKKVREVAHKTIIEVEGKLAALSRDKELYKAIKSYKMDSEKLDEDEKIIVKDTMRAFKKMGFHLSDEKQKEALKLTQEAQKLSAQFAKNINDYEDHILVSKKDLEGLSQNYIETLKKDTKTGKYIVTLSDPDFVPFMRDCKDEALRKKLKTKGFREGGVKNIKILEKLIAVRKKKANLVGYDTYADLVIDGRMAKKPANVENLLEDIGEKMRPLVKKDVALLTKAKRAHLKNPKAAFHTWDTGFYANKILKEEYAIDQEKLREYLPLDHVMQFMFNHFGNLYGFKVQKTDLPKWEKSLEWYKVIDGKSIVGYIGFDFFPRPGKYTHQAVWPIITGGLQKYKSGEYTTPVSVMIGNFSKSGKSKSPLITLSEVRTLFHEFGHMLHNTLSTARFSSQSGTSVAHDFVELPSQFNERWLSEPDFLKNLGKHYKTGEKIPDETIAAIKKAKGFLRASSEGMQNMLALYDLALHSKTKLPKDINTLFNKMYKKHTGLDITKDALFPAHFGHIASHYGAGYYGYKWAEIYAYDAYSVFQKKGIYNKAVGKKYRKEILEKGSSRDEMESLKKFLGRKPNNKAFLKDIGLK